ncbi:MAG: hypothetical protein NTW80_10755 [Deltaproteobacteria bacterium]|nr:hypothetical protein [Deltaproteobacteria bacterium]
MALASARPPRNFVAGAARLIKPAYLPAPIIADVLARLAALIT